MGARCQGGCGEKENRRTRRTMTVCCRNREVPETGTLRGVGGEAFLPYPMLFKVFYGRRGATRDHEPRRGEGSALPIRRRLAATRLETSSFARCATEDESSRRWRRVHAAHSGSFAAPGHGECCQCGNVASIQFQFPIWPAQTFYAANRISSAP